MYFSTGGAADGTGQAAAYEAGKLVGVVPLTTGTTAAYFERNLGEWDNKSGRDKIVFTHDNTASSTDGTAVGHRCKNIAKAIAEVANAAPHHTMVDMVDLDNNTFYSDLSFVTGIAITLQDQA